MKKREIGCEMLQNMELTREQYENACSLIDELALEKGPLRSELPKEDEWSTLIQGFGKIV